MGKVLMIGFPPLWPSQLFCKGKSRKRVRRGKSGEEWGGKKESTKHGKEVKSWKKHFLSPCFRELPYQIKGSKTY